MSDNNVGSSLNPGKYKMIICIRRKQGMTKEEFQDYWLNKHGPLAASVQARGLAPPMLGYVQNHTVDTPLMAEFRDARGMNVEPYDGITEVWLDDPADLDMSESITDELIEANQMLVDDEAKFVDLAESSVFITRQHNIFMTLPKKDFFKMIICDHCLPSMSRDQFQDYWLNHHAPLATSVRERGYAPPMLGYVQNHTLDIPMLEPFRQARGMTLPAYDGIAEVWLNKMEDLSKVDLLDPQQIKVNNQLLEDENKFVDFKRCSVFITIPYRIF